MFRRLDSCGHRCLATCHSEPMHWAFSCPQPCERLFDGCGHECSNACGQPCGRCKTMVENVLLPCGHVEPPLFCYEQHEVSKITCNVSVVRKISKRGHVVEIPCHQDVDCPEFRCAERCTSTLKCGHACKGACFVTYLHPEIVTWKRDMRNVLESAGASMQHAIINAAEHVTQKKIVDSALRLVR